MVELFIIEYLTVLYMIMAFLFMDSRYSRRRTIFIVFIVTILLLAAVAALYRVVDVDTAFWVYAVTIHIPLLLLLFTLSRFRGWRLIFQQLSVVLFCTLIHHETGLIYRPCQCPGKRHLRQSGAASKPEEDPLQNGGHTWSHAENFQSMYRKYLF